MIDVDSNERLGQEKMVRTMICSGVLGSKRRKEMKVDV